MGRWMIQLFSLKQLDAMEQKDYDILKNMILKQLETNSEILKVLEKKVRPVYKQIAAKKKTIGKQPMAKKKTRPVYKRRASKRHR
jgi:hypothetical protein